MNTVASLQKYFTQPFHQNVCEFAERDFPAMILFTCYRIIGHLKKQGAKIKFKFPRKV